MLRLVKICLLLAIAAALVVFAVANSQNVTLSLVPDGVLSPATTERLRIVEVPLYAALLGALLFGILVGEMVEWSRARRYRRELRAVRRELTAARAKVVDLRGKIGDEDDDLLRLSAV